MTIPASAYASAVRALTPKQILHRPRRLVPPRLLGAGLAPEETALIPDRSDEWMTRIRVAKKAAAAAKDTSGALLPERIRIHGVDGQRVQVADVTVNTVRHEDYIIGWTT